MRVTARIADDPIEGLNLGLAAAALGLSFGFASALFSASVAIGAVLEIANFRALRRASESLFRGEIAGSRPWAGLFGLRLVFLGVGMYVALGLGADPVGLAIGLSTIVPAVVWVAWSAPPPAAPGASAMSPDDPRWDDWNAWLARETEPADEEAS